MISGENFNFLGGIGVKVGRLMCRVPPRLLLARPQGYCQTPLPTVPKVDPKKVLVTCDAELPFFRQPPLIIYKVLRL